MKKIGIIGAMDCEVELLCKALEGCCTEKKNGITFYTGRLGRLDAVIAKCGIGKVNAAITATAMISSYAPDAVVNTGCMGGLNPALNVGDIVVSSCAVEHDLDYAVLGDAPGSVYMPDGNCVIDMKADEKLAASLVETAGACGAKALLGKLASGDRFVCTDEERKRIRDTFSADGCEMEGAAVAHACSVAGVPFCIIRAISDSANGDAGMSYAEFSRMAAEISAKILIEFSKKQA